MSWEDDKKEIWAFVGKYGLFILILWILAGMCRSCGIFG